MQLRKHAEFAAHVVRGFDLAAEGRPAQNHFAIAEMHKIRQIGMAARELLDGERTRAARKIAQQESLQPGEVGFFAWPYGSGMVSKISHVSVAELPPLTVRQQGRIVEMRKRIE